VHEPSGDLVEAMAVSVGLHHCDVADMVGEGGSNPT